MERKWRAVFVSLVILVGLGGTAYGDYNPSGWIQTGGWNLLFPLLNPDGCGGGGTGKMAGNWVAPHVIGLEDPKGSLAQEWADIDFGNAALSTGWGAATLNPAPIWVTKDVLEGLAGPGCPVGDVVDYQAIVDWINTATGAGVASDNVLGIATTYVENVSGAPLAVSICSASDDSIAVYVNNLLITNVSSCRGTAGDCNERFSAVLPVGVSKITTLTFEGGGGWGFRLALELGGTTTKLADGNGLVNFLGTGGSDTNTKGQVQYAAERSVAMDPFICDNDTADVRIQGNAATGADGDAVQVVENIYNFQSANMTISDVSDGGVVEDIRSPVGLLDDHRVIGVIPCGNQSTTTFNDGGTPADPSDDEYTSVSNTGRDLWDAGDANNDSFEFAYSRLSGDFDIGIMITGKTNTTGTRWGKWGLMARWNYDRASRYTIMQDHSNDPQDPCRLAGRTVHLTTGNMYEDLQSTGDPAFDHPLFMRLQRSGNVVRGYISNDGGTWYQVGRDDDWGGGAPAELLVGFANSQHNSGGCGVQTVKFKIISATVTPASFLGVGKKITWNLTRGDVNAGLSYKISTTGALPVSLAGEVVGESAISGPGSVSLQAIPRTGPIGIFDDSHDIDSPPTQGLTTYDAATGQYSVFGSGGDIWDGGDAFQFAYKHVAGDFVATAHVVSRGINNPGYRWGRHGLMARYSCRSDAKHTMLEEMFLTSAGEYDWIRHHFRMYDQNAGNNRDYLQVNDGIFPTEGQFPQWMRIVRRANSIFSYLSEDANSDGKPDEWLPMFGDSSPNMPSTLLVGLAVQGRQEWGQTAVFDKVTIEPLDGRYDFEPLMYETAASNTAGIGSRPYAPKQVVARIPASLADAQAQGGSGLGVKNRNWIWTDLTAGSVDLWGMTQLLWNNENRNFTTAHMRYVFQSAAKVYIAWDARLVKGGSDNPDGTVDNGWFDFNNDKGTVNKQGWLRLTARSDDTTPLAEEIRTDADANFARGGVWTKEVGSGDVLDFLATGFSAGRSPYVVFVQTLVQTCVAADEIARLDYEGADDLGVVVVRSGGFTPQVVNGRLRVTQDDTASSATAVWYGVAADPDAGGVPLLEEGFVAEFDAYMTHSGQANPDFNPADNMGFVVVATGANDGLTSAIAPWVPGLDVASLCGDGGGSLAYHGGTMMERTETHPNFMIEMDTWYGSSDAVNEPYGYGSTDFDGFFHFGLDISGQANSVQTSGNLSIPAASMPYAFNPAGVHVEVMYEPTGWITVWASGVTKSGETVTRGRMLQTAIEPLTVGDLVLGFVGATGGAVCTQEFDNFVVRRLCCEQPDGATISGPVEANQGSTAQYTAEVSGAETGSTVTYAWSADPPGAVTISPTDTKTVNVTFNNAGQVMLRVDVNDGTCSTGYTTYWTVDVKALTCGVSIACGVANADTNKVPVTVTVGATPPDCMCDTIVVTQAGAEVYRGPVAGVPAEFAIPADCEDPTKIVFEAKCVGILGDGVADSCEATCPVRQQPFIRGDCNQDGEVCRQVSDIVRMIEILFLGKPMPSCPAACDANGDGNFGGEISDPMYIANYCFTGENGPPEAPFPGCGRGKPEETCDGDTYCN